MFTINAIIAAVAAEFAVTKQEILSSSRVARIAHPRAIAIGLARELTDKKMTQIARAFNRNHSTTYTAVERGAELLRKHPAYRVKREAVIRSLQPSNQP